MAKDKGATKPKAKLDFPCAECKDTFESKELWRAHVVSAHINPNKEKYADTVMKVLAKHGGVMERDELLKLCQEANPSMSKDGAGAFSDPLNQLIKKGKVRFRKLIELAEK